MDEKKKKRISMATSSPKSSPQKNLTGNPRIVRDLVLDIHESIQRWNDVHIHGVSLLKNITNIKVDQTFPEGLQELCDELEKDVDKLDQEVAKLKLISHRIGAAALLHRGQGALFKAMQTEEFVRIAELIYDSYRQEAEVKRKVLENVSHDHGDSWKMLHSASWTYQPMLPYDLDVNLETLLLETGLR